MKELLIRTVTHIQTKGIELCFGKMKVQLLFKKTNLFQNFRKEPSPNQISKRPLLSFYLKGVQAATFYFENPPSLSRAPCYHQRSNTEFFRAVEEV